MKLKKIDKIIKKKQIKIKRIRILFNIKTKKNPMLKDKIKKNQNKINSNRNNKNKI